MHGRARRRAAAVLSDVVGAFGAAGYRQAARRDPLEAVLTSDRGPDLWVRLRSTGGRVFGGTFALEVATARAVFPRTHGVSARGRGVVRLRAIEFRGKGRDPEGRRLATRLTADRSLANALAPVHFEQARVDPEGRAVIRHMGGSLVWLLFPPMTRPIPIVPEQVRATAAALEAFAKAAGRARDPAR